MAGLTIRPAQTQSDFETARTLFLAYASSLGIELDYQDFEREVAQLPGKYASPDGAILLARDSRDAPIGCVALRPLGDGLRCEMKRLYVVPAAQSSGVGSALTMAVIEEAVARGYVAIRLDTLPTMAPAVRLYARCGFCPIKPYYSPTPPGTVFMELDLTKATHE